MRCVEYVNPDVFRLLKNTKEMGLKTVIVSNCSSEEVKKPDACIYEEAAKRLDVTSRECIFVGDGGRL